MSRPFQATNFGRGSALRCAVTVAVVVVVVVSAVTAAVVVVVGGVWNEV